MTTDGAYAKSHGSVMYGTSDGTPEGTARPLKVNSSGQLVVSTDAVAGATDGGSGSSLVNEVQVKTGSGVLHEMLINLDSGASARWALLFDRTDALSGGEEPLKRIALSAGPGGFIYTPQGGLDFTNGLRVATSSTLATFTNPGDTVAAFDWNVD